MSGEEILDVVVVGAGLSGLSAAKLLSTRNVNFIVLEARDRVGGRTLTKQSSECGGYVDLGGSYVGPTQNRILRFAKDVGVESYKINDKGKSLLYVDGLRRAIDGENFCSLFQPLEYLDTNNLYREIDRMGDQIPADAPWTSKHAKIWDNITCEEYFKKTCFTSTGRAMAKFSVNINVTSEPCECSLLYFLWYIKQCGGMKRVNATANGGQERKFLGGSQQISTRVAETLKASMRLCEPVYSIASVTSSITEVKTLPGKVYRTRFVILAIPPVLQMNIHFSPPLPAERQQLCQRMPMGSIIKALLYYRTCFWRMKGYSGVLFIMGDEKHPAVSVLDDTKPDGSAPCLVLFLAADKCRDMMGKTKEEREKACKESLFEVLRMDEVYDATHYEEFNWCDQQYSGGCYTAICTPGILTNYGRFIRQSFGTVFFAGTETATQWSGFMDGAIEAGERAAREVLHELGLIAKDDVFREEPPFEGVIAEPFHSSFWERNLPSAKVLIKACKFTVTLAVLTICILKYRQQK